GTNLGHGCTPRASRSPPEPGSSISGVKLKDLSDQRLRQGMAYPEGDAQGLLTPERFYEIPKVPLSDRGRIPHQFLGKSKGHLLGRAALVPVSTSQRPQTLAHLILVGVRDREQCPTMSHSVETVQAAGDDPPKRESHVSVQREILTQSLPTREPG